MSIIGKRFKLHGNNVGLGVDGKERPIGRSTYASGTEVVIIGETNNIPSLGRAGTVTCRVLGVSPDHFARFNRLTCTFTEIQ